MNSTFALLLVGFAILISFVLFVPVLKLVMDLSAHAYPNARISAVQGKRLKKEDYRTLLETTTLADVVAMLENTPYAPAFSEIGGTIDIEAFDLVMKQESIKQKQFLLDVMPLAEKNIYRTFLKFDEIAVLKDIIASKYSDSKYDIQPYGFFDTKMLEHLSDASDLDELLRRLETSEYYDPLKEAFAEFKNSNNLFYLNSALDKYLSQQLWSRVAIQMPDGRYVKQFFGIYFDVENIKMALRSKNDSVKITADHFLYGHYEIDDKIQKKIIDAETVDSVLSALEGTSYHAPLSEAIVRGSDNIEPLEVALTQFKMNKAPQYSLADVLGPGKALSYLLNLDKEIRNLRIIAKSKSAGLSAEKTEKMLIY